MCFILIEQLLRAKVGFVEIFMPSAMVAALALAVRYTNEESAVFQGNWQLSRHTLIILICSYRPSGIYDRKNDMKKGSRPP